MTACASAGWRWKEDVQIAAAQRTTRPQQTTRGHYATAAYTRVAARPSCRHATDCVTINSSNITHTNAPRRHMYTHSHTTIQALPAVCWLLPRTHPSHTQTHATHSLQNMTSVLPGPPRRTGAQHRARTGPPCSCPCSTRRPLAKPYRNAVRFPNSRQERCHCWAYRKPPCLPCPVRARRAPNTDQSQPAWLKLLPD